MDPAAKKSLFRLFEEPLYLLVVEFGYRVALYFLLGRKLAADLEGLGQQGKAEDSLEAFKAIFRAHELP